MPHFPGPGPKFGNFVTNPGESVAPPGCDSGKVKTRTSRFPYFCNNP